MSFCIKTKEKDVIVLDLLLRVDILILLCLK